jgi:two-component system OmpR family sensor kinase
LSAIKESGISLAENRTFRAFVLLYTLMAVLILALLGAIYYKYRKEVMLSEHRLAMQLQSESYIPKMRKWLNEGKSVIPEDLAYATALYDAEGRALGAYLEEPMFDLKEPISLSNGYIHYVIPLASYELGDYFLVFETKDDGLWLRKTLQTILIFGTLLFVALSLVGFYLSSLFLRPMKEAIKLLDDFIKDTTHELNTPVSAIVSNIEMVDAGALDEKTAKKINRIAIAARTISTIYDDLTYLVLNHNLAVKNERLDLTALIAERLEYFQTRYEQKRLKVRFLREGTVHIMIDRNKAARLVDNLLSNAIKYNRIGGSITVECRPGTLRISDTGKGIPEAKIQRVFERYQRADESVGGFGIGLSIVAMIAREYRIAIDIESHEGRGTAITLEWAPEAG